MRKTKVLFALLAAFCFTAVSAQSASALSITGATPFTGQQVSANQVFNIGTAVRVTCTHATITNGTLGPNTIGGPSTNMATFTIAYHNNVTTPPRPCTAVIAGITVNATVTVTCQWSIVPTSFTSGSGVGWIRVCTTTITLSSFGCVITVPTQTITSGGTYQNLTSPNRVRVTVNIPGGATPGVNWTQNGSCPGLPASATSTTPAQYAGYQGTIDANGLQVIP